MVWPINPHDAHFPRRQVGHYALHNTRSGDGAHRKGQDNVGINGAGRFCFSARARGFRLADPARALYEKRWDAILSHRAPPIVLVHLPPQPWGEMTLERMTHTELRAALARLRTSQRAFATEIGANERTVRRWVSGKQDIPKWVQVVIRLAEQLTKPSP